MTIGQNSNYYYNGNYPINFRNASYAVPLISKPIEKVENVITSTVDTFVKTPKDEEKKKSHKKAITVGSSIIVVTALAALFNPRFSGKSINKLKQWTSKTAAKAEKSTFYKTCNKVLTRLTDIFQFTNSLNAGKDQGFKWLTSSEKNLSGIKNETLRNIVSKIDFGFRKICSKPCDMITNWFDKVGKSTVYSKYNKAGKEMNHLEEILNYYKRNLSAADKIKLEAKMKEIEEARKYFSKSQTTERLKHQENVMSNLEADFIAKWKDFWGKFKKPTSKEAFRHDKNLLNDNMSFWAEDILMPTRNQLEKDGIKQVDVLLGNGKDVRGKYNEIIDILSPNITESEKKAINDVMKRTTKKLRKANRSESVEYFDKKRDLVLGGAPTDILTNAGMLGLSGIAIGLAHNKEDRTSRALTLGFPAIAGIGTSIALTAKLFSGVQGMIYGALAGCIFSQVGSITNRHFNPKAPLIAENSQKQSSKEVNNA